MVYLIHKRTFLEKDEPMPVLEVLTQSEFDKIEYINGLEYDNDLDYEIFNTWKEYLESEIFYLITEVKHYKKLCKLLQKKFTDIDRLCNGLKELFDQEKNYKIGDKVIFGYNIGVITGYDTLFNRYKIGSRFAYEYEINLATKENMKQLASERLAYRKSKWLQDRIYNSYQHTKSKYKDVSIRCFI